MRQKNHKRKGRQKVREMKLTVYHVTSTIFLSSIRNNGLINIDLRRVFPEFCKAMTEMISLLDCKYGASEIAWGEPIGFRGNCQRMANINYKNQSKMDYEYGSVYVTSSKTKLAIYNTYEFGSELLTYFFRLYRCLYQKHKDETKNQFDSMYPELVNIININNKKNLVLKVEVDTSDLLSDTGSQLKEEDIEFIQFMQKECDGDVQRSFRMARVLRPDEIEILTLDNNVFTSYGKLSEYKIPVDWQQINVF